MEVLFIGGRFESCCYPEVINKTKTVVDDAGNTSQTRLIKGLQEQNIDLTEISAPYIGPWPTVYRDIVFRGFQSEGNKTDGVRYVHFNNIWGYRNISRARAVKREVDVFLKEKAGHEKAIIVYMPHTPFLEAAVYAKKKEPGIHINLIVTDLPQYMNNEGGRKPIYWFFKKIDLKRFYKLNRYVDSYTLLTEYMTEPLSVGARPYIVTEGIADITSAAPQKERREKTVAYAGRLYETFGVKQLVDAFCMLPDQEARLKICGGGEMSDYIKAKAQEDRRIEYYGLLPSDKARELLRSADVLVNPRKNVGEYTKYSFPSKNIEYLLTGNTVIAYMLDGIPEVYRKFFTVPDDDSVEALARTLQSALAMSKEEQEERFQASLAYLRDNCSSEVVASKIIRLMAEQS